MLEQEAAFAIEKSSGDLYAAMLEDGVDFDRCRMLRVFGTSDARSVPWPLSQWISCRQERYHNQE